MAGDEPTGLGSRPSRRDASGPAILAEARAGKRDRFVKNPPSKGNGGLRFIGIPLLLSIIVGVGVYFVAGESLGIAPKSGPEKSSAVTTGNTATNTATSEKKAALVSLPVSTFDDGKAHYYTYKSEAPSGKQIRFFVLKSSDGVIRAAFDACDVCYTFKKGYHQEGDEMVCNNCGQRFPSVRINEVKGGCNPSPLTRIVDKDTLIIEEKDIVAEGEQYF